MYLRHAYHVRYYRRACTIRITMQSTYISAYTPLCTMYVKCSCVGRTFPKYVHVGLKQTHKYQAHNIVYSCDLYSYIHVLRLKYKGVTFLVGESHTLFFPEHCIPYNIYTY